MLCSRILSPTAPGKVVTGDEMGRGGLRGGHNVVLNYRECLAWDAGTGSRRECCGGGDIPLRNGDRPLVRLHSEGGAEKSWLNLSEKIAAGATAAGSECCRLVRGQTHPVLRQWQKNPRAM